MKNGNDNNDGLFTALMIGGLAVLGVAIAASEDEDSRNARLKAADANRRVRDQLAADRRQRRHEENMQRLRDASSRRYAFYFGDDQSVARDLLSYLKDSDLLDSQKVAHIQMFAKSGRTVDPVTAARIVDSLSSSWRRQQARESLDGCVA